ncbi:MAG TPA: PQQ-binding-like beta-propeller repeat protein, partial [Gemmatimonadales bacterium]|nr:PQQ-binding-like beta-propeller repeat protein [Gemmatimonadales bacterium]
MKVRTTLLALLVPSLAAAQSADWPLHGHDLGGQRFSPLKTIDTANVSHLDTIWTWHSGISATFQTTPVVVGDRIYLSLPFSSVAALDARSGNELWRYSHKPRTTKFCCGPANRGVAVAGGRVFVGTVDGRLIALDQASGKVLWDVTVASYQGTTEATSQLSSTDPMAAEGSRGSTGVGIGAAPLAYDGKVFVGIAGVGYGLHPDQGLA